MNFKIRVPEVRVLGADGQMVGVMPTREAQRLAEQQGLDLVEVSPNAVPPVCRIMDYGKFRYEESIKRKQARKSQKTAMVKEIKFHPGVETNDLEHKVRQISEFLKAGHKVRVTMQYRGRENAHKDLGQDVIQRVIDMLADCAVLEQAPKHMGRLFSCLMSPRSTKSSGAPKES